MSRNLKRHRDRNARIVILRRQGASFTQIACALDVSRNVVAGVVWRGGLCSRPAPGAFRWTKTPKRLWPEMVL